MCATFCQAGAFFALPYCAVAFRFMIALEPRKPPSYILVFSDILCGIWQPQAASAHGAASVVSGCLGQWGH